MKKTNFKLKTNVLNRAVFITALLLAAGVLFTACPQKVKEEPKPVYYTVSLVHEGGSLTANPALQEGKALKDSEITFTASPANFVSHEVDKWEVSGGTKISGGEEGSASVKVKITGDTTVKVTFKEKPKYTVTITGTSNGTVTPGSDISQPFYKGTVIKFTAEPASGYGVGKWTITGGTIVSGGKSWDKTASVSITGDTSVKVDFDCELKLKTLEIFGEDASSGSMIVKGKKEVTPSDVIAKFDYGTQTNQQISVTVTNGTLKLGENTVSLSVEGSAGNYAGWSKDIKVIKEYITYDIEGIEFTMKVIVAVDAQLGHNDYYFNKPHTVSLSGYLIGETEVTQELWQAVMGNNPSFFDGSSGKEPAAGETQGKRPVENVNWYHAIAFCNKLSIKLNLDPCYTVRVGGNPVDFETLSFDQIPTGNNTDWNKAELDMNKKGFRLPTEAEWEWAAKGGTDDKWAGTNTEAELTKYAWYDLNSGSKTHEVKKKSPNGYGLYDMSGNVLEWCWDWSGYLPDSPEADYTGAASGSDRVNRGGSRYSYAYYCTVGFRSSHSPDGRYNTLGFRLACRP
ncbi:formylglycine-generating enzyme family protein [Treponema denticola]|uniref:formylglycine-generating enzyme family protein n=1 Tax=Treponema denticola TaxID=158 RepID=UPI003D8A95AF